MQDQAVPVGLDLLRQAPAFLREPAVLCWGRHRGDNPPLNGSVPFAWRSCRRNRRCYNSKWCVSSAR